MCYPGSCRSNFIPQFCRALLVPLISLSLRPFAYPSSPRATRQHAKSRYVTSCIFRRIQTPHFLTSIFFSSYKRLGGIGHSPKINGCGLYFEPAQCGNGLYLEPVQ